MRWRHSTGSGRHRTAEPSSTVWPEAGRTGTPSTAGAGSASCAPRGGPSGGEDAGMPKYLLDSDVVIEWLRGNARVVAWVRDRDAAGDFLAWSPVSIAEVYAGLRHSEEFVIGDLVHVLHCVELDERVGQKGGGYRREDRQSPGVEAAVPV